VVLVGVGEAVVGDALVRVEVWQVGDEGVDPQLQRQPLEFYHVGLVFKLKLLECGVDQGLSVRVDANQVLKKRV